MLKNRQLRNILGPKRDEVTGGGRKLLIDYPNKFRCYHPVVFQIEFIYIFGCVSLVELTLRRLMSYIYIYGAPILDVSRSHTTTQHSR